MKNLFLFIFLVATSYQSSAQVPNSIPYQAVVRNTDGSPMASTTVTINFSIHNLTAAGDVVYQETHSTTTNTQGLVSLSIGSGTPVTGNFSAINWGAGAKFLQVAMNAGNGNIDLGTQQLMSVPYALYAEDVNVRVSNTGDTLTLGGNSLIVPGVSNSNNAYPAYSISNMYSQGSGVYDIDGNFYPTIVLYNGQEWMQKNLEVTKYRNGESLITGLDEFTWAPSTSGAYISSALEGLPYGHYYNWYAVSDLRGLCPTGWHVPNYFDWNNLKNSLGGADFAGCLMKSTETWSDPNYPSFNLSGFSGLSGGFGSSGVVGTGALGYSGLWWSSSVNNNGWPMVQELFLVSNSIVEQLDYYHNGYSIRCIKD